MNMILEKKQQGLTLIELLIAMLIGTLLILGASSMFIANKRVYKEVDYQGRLAENARFAMEMMIRDLRMAGFIGCAVREEVVNNLAVPDGTELLSYISKSSGAIQPNSIEGSEGGANWLPSGSTDVTAGDGVTTTPSLEPGSTANNDVTMLITSDGFTTRFLEDTNTNLCESMGSVNANLTVRAQAGAQIPGGLFVDGGLFVASDCEATNLFQLTSNADAEPFILEHSTGSGSPGNQVSTLSKQYTVSSTNCTASPVDIHQFRARRYFVAIDQDTNRPGLYRQVYDINPNAPGAEPEEFAERIIDGVENMQILYGEDTTGKDRVADTYVTATAVTNWEDVVSVKLAVLFATVEEDFSAPFDTKSDYRLLDQIIDPTTGTNDRRRRKVVEATISLRNRQLSL
ncbi:MAG: hypothetical protein CMF40_01415 [Legionellales bacterium]|nr:hypothetical protein [Legionellales bacterium]